MVEPRVLPREFFERDPRIVGKELLGKLLVRCYGSEILLGRIVETEAYLGKGDPAAHSASGPTARNAVIFGPPGHAYVYFIYMPFAYGWLSLFCRDIFTGNHLSIILLRYV